MTLIDTSAWVEFLRDTGSSTSVRVENLLKTKLTCCEPVMLELLAGAQSETHLRNLRRLVARCVMLKTESIDYEMAAVIYRNCRSKGKTPRKMIDCLIAAIAIRNQVRVLHQDQDFDVIAKHSELKLA
jgi:predicted nucleic acid-binding protein